MLNLASLSILLSICLSSSGSTENPNELVLHIVSDTSIKVMGPSANPQKNAVETYMHPNWPQQISGAKWIWDSFKVSSPSIEQACVFSKWFPVFFKIKKATIELAADDNVIVVMNTLKTGCEKNGADAGRVFACDLTDFMHTGMNSLEIKVTNAAIKNSNSENNPAGVVFKLTIIGSG
jgi:hypothetical protein